MKRTELKRSTPLRSRPKHLRLVEEPGRAEWKTPVGGVCACGCGKWATRLHRHHIVLEQIVRRENGNPWDLANSMLLHPDCHRRHHDAFRKIKLDRVPDVALEFAVELLGAAGAMAYFDRKYDSSVPMDFEGAA